MHAAQLITRLAELGQQYARRRRRLRAIAYSWCRDRSLSEDLVQETFLKALRGLKALREDQALDAWLFQILLNCWRDHLRRARPTDDIDSVLDCEALRIDADHDRGERVARVRAAVAALPAGQREVLCLVDLEGYSYAEVAQRLKIPTGTVTSRVVRAREALRAILGELNDRPDPKIVKLRRAR